MSLYADFAEGTARIEPAYPVGETREMFFHFKKRRLTAREIARVWKNIQRRGGFMTSSICSWPPEDARIESFLRQVRARALERLGESHRQVEAFATSFLDGIDVRETVRRWNESKIFVRRERNPRGRIGPVVVVWEDDPIDAREQWRTTLYAEHQNESEISIVCAPPPGRDIVGPGISRLKYRSLLSVYPARRIPDIWEDPLFFVMWRTHARAQIAAALLLSDAPHVCVVSATTPDAELRALARTLRINIIHLPLTAFSSSLLERVRTLHILSDKEIRRWAEHYIPK